MIPKTIHYCWFNKDKDKPLPKVVQKCIDSWKAVVPDFEIILWNEDTFDVYSDSFPFVKEAYESGKYAYVADYIRLWAVYNYGGIYLDADVEILKRFDKLLKDPAFMGMENPYALGSAIVGGEKGNPAIKFLLECYNNMHFIREDGSLNITLSNYVFTDGLRDYGYHMDNTLQVFPDITIYPKEYLYPHDDNFITENTMFIHRLMVSHIKQISVVMPVHNAEKYLRECIDSVLQQTYDNFEFIIIDNGSTDSSIDIINSYTDSRIVLVKQENKSIADTLNMGIKRATGKYIALMDVNDIMLRNRLEVQYNCLEQNPKIDILGAGFQLFGETVPKGLNLFLPDPKGLVLKENLLINNCVIHPTVMIRKSSLNKLSVVYENGYEYAEDYKFWLNALSHGLLIFNIPHALLRHRKSFKSEEVEQIKQESTQKIKDIYN